MDMDAPRVTDGRLLPVGELALGAARERGATDILRLTRLRALWVASVGGVLANVSRPESLINGRLTVAVCNGTWAMTIAGMQKKLLISLRANAPDLEILRLRTVIGEIVEDGPPPRREPDGPPMPNRGDLDGIELTAAAQRSVDLAVEQITDDDLRAHFAAAMRRSQQHRQWCLGHGWSIDPRNGDLIPPPPDDPPRTRR